jgi:hypothetical protein
MAAGRNAGFVSVQPQPSDSRRTSGRSRQERRRAHLERLGTDGVLEETVGGKTPGLDRD